MTDRGDERPAETSDKFQSLAALRVAHLDLMRSRPQDKKLGRALHAAAIRQSLDRMRTAGAFISDEDERQKAQSILDYWNAELVNGFGNLKNYFVVHGATEKGMGMTDQRGKRRYRGTSRCPQDGFEAPYRAGQKKIA